MEPLFCMRMLHLYAIILFLYLHQTYINAEKEWAYEGDNGPGNWHATFPHCAGLRQSPVSIPTNETIVDSDWLVPFKMRGSDAKHKLQMNLENKGHTIQVHIEGEPISITGGGLKDAYIAQQLHFHWGKTERGSEHNIDGKYFPIEMHIVHYNTKYKNFSEALNKEDGLAVLAFMFEAGNHNRLLDHIINHFSEVPFRGNQTVLETIGLRKLLPNSLDTYCRYYGSLTTPPCYESVIWFIFYETIEISENQLKSFRQNVHQNLINETIGHRSDYFRPPQYLNQRTIRCSKQVKTRMEKTTNQAKPGKRAGQQHLPL